MVSESEPKSAEPQPKAGFFPGLWKRKTISPEPRVKFKQSNDATRLPILNVLHEKGVATLLAMRSRIFTSRANSCA